jgi:hypothetical protein
MTPEFRDLTQKAFTYRDNKRLAENHREFGVSTEMEEDGLRQARMAFAKIYLATIAEHRHE